MLRDYRDWLEAEVGRLRANDQAATPLDAAGAMTLARDRFEAETSDALCVEIERPLARRILTSLEILGQQTTSVRPEFDALRNAIKAAFEEGILPPPQEREPIEQEVL